MKGSRREKLEYFWMYYKIPFLAVVAFLVIAIYFVSAAVTEKENGFSAILFDIHTDAEQSGLEEEYADYADIDTKKYEVLINTSLLLDDTSSTNYKISSISKFYSLIGTEDLDVCMMTEADFEKYEKEGTYLDLSTCMTKEELSKFPELYEQDGKVLGIYGNELSKIKEISGYPDGEKAIVGIVYNSKHVERSISFLEYLNQ